MTARQYASNTAFVFDLDDVLLPTTALFDAPGVRDWLRPFWATRNLSRITAGYHRVVHPNPLVIHLLQQLQGPKFILTNASRVHAYSSLTALGLLPYFISQLDADHGLSLKPHASPYVRMQDVVRAHMEQRRQFPYVGHGPHIVFFDDRVENHVVPKRMGWTTVWIYGAVMPDELRRYASLPPQIDVAFQSVEQALQHFAQRRG